jgi:hypothetical protein
MPPKKLPHEENDTFDDIVLPEPGAGTERKKNKRALQEIDISKRNITDGKVDEDAHWRFANEVDAEIVKIGSVGLADVRAQETMVERQRVAFMEKVIEEQSQQAQTIASAELEARRDISWQKLLNKEEIRLREAELAKHFTTQLKDQQVVDRLLPTSLMAVFCL